MNVIDLFAGPKSCTKCGEAKDLDEFHRDSRRPDGRVQWCKDCRRDYRKRKYDEDPEAAIAYAREWKRRNRDRLPHYGRKFRHGITAVQYQQLVDSQDGKCAICGRSDGDLRVDHCHERNVIRGLLCDRCNRGIGFFKDNPVHLTNAAAYVRRQEVMPRAR